MLLAMKFILSETGVGWMLQLTYQFLATLSGVCMVTRLQVLIVSYYYIVHNQLFSVRTIMSLNSRNPIGTYLRRYTVGRILLIGHMSLISDDAISVPCILPESRFEFGLLCCHSVSESVQSLIIYTLLVVTTAQIYNRFLVTNGITNVSGQVMQAIYRVFSTNHNEWKACICMHAYTNSPLLSTEPN